MTEADPLTALRRDAAALDALAAGGSHPVGAASNGAAADPALDLLTALRAEVDALTVLAADTAVSRDARLLDAVARGRAVPVTADRAAALLATLRDQVDALPTLADVGAPGPWDLGRRRVSHRRLRLGQRRAARAAVLAVTAASALSTSGVAAAAFSSHPGSSLYGLRAAVFGRTDDDPEVPRELLREAQRQYDLAEQDPGRAAQHLAVGQGLVTRAQSLLPRVVDAAAVPVLATDARVLRQRLDRAPQSGVVAAGAPGAVAAARGSQRPAAAGRSVPGPSAGPQAPVPGIATVQPSLAGVTSTSTSTSASASAVASPEPDPTTSASGSPPASGSATPTAAPSASPTEDGATPTATPTPPGTPSAVPSGAVTPTVSGSASPALSGPARPSGSARSSPTPTKRPTARPVRRAPRRPTPNPTATRPPGQPQLDTAPPTTDPNARSG